MNSPLSRKPKAPDNTALIYQLLKTVEGNKKCFDCCSRYPTDINVTCWTFVCARCSGLLRDFGHRIKSISASRFSDEEVDSLSLNGNVIAATIWLASWSPQIFNQPNEDDNFALKAFMKEKYENLRYYRGPKQPSVDLVFFINLESNSTKDAAS